VNPPTPAATPTPPCYELSEVGLAQALADLGETPDQVAGTLRRGNHHGAVCSKAACPLTGYLAAMFPAAAYVRVTSTQALLRHRGGTVKVWLPRPSSAPPISTPSTGDLDGSVDLSTRGGCRSV
jgi:hypothetical protein